MEEMNGAHPLKVRTALMSNEDNVNELDKRTLEDHRVNSPSIGGHDNIIQTKFLHDEECGAIDASLESPSEEQKGDQETASSSGEIDATPAHRRVSGRDFDLICRLAMALGAAAMKYGSSAGLVEQFLDDLMNKFGYSGSVFRATQSELFCCFRRPYPECIDEENVTSVSDDTNHNIFHNNPQNHQSGICNTTTHIVVVESGMNLNKLGLLSDLAKECVEESNIHSSDLSLVFEKLDQIDRSQDPWGDSAVFLAFFAVGGSLAMLLEGGWWDIIAGTMCGGLVFGILNLSSRFSAGVRVWTNFAAAFSCALFSTLLKSGFPKINVALVTLSGVAIQVPGYNVSLGTQELVSNHIVSGASHLISGLVTLMWLSTGFWLGKSLGTALVKIDETGSIEKGDPVPFGFAGIAVPILLVSVSVVFQNSKRDMPWACLGMTVTFITSYLAGTYIEANLGTFLSAIAMTLFANIWAQYTNRPHTLVLLPSFVLKVSGSIGFLGLIALIDGEKFVGMEQFLQMFIVALLIIAGMFAGNALIPTRTTI